MEFAVWDEARCGELIEAHLSQKGSALPILHAIQNEFGFVPDAAMLLIADALNVTRADVYGIVTFYHDFRRQPAGRNELRLCRAEACQASGSAEVAAAVCKKFQIHWGETSSDNALTLGQVFCLGLCAVAPSGMLNGLPVGRLDPDTIIEQLDRCL